MDRRDGTDALYHSTMHGDPPSDPDRLLTFRPLDPTNRPAALKRYVGVKPVLLPRSLRRSSLPAIEVLSGRGAQRAALDDDLLGTLLFLSAGVTRVAYVADQEPTWFRASMSAGNLHPVELYVVRHGVHHYQPLEHALVTLRGGPEVIDPAVTTVVLTGIPFRTCWKYGERGWRHLWWDAGCVLANLLAVADAFGVPARVSVGFVDDTVSQLVGIDGVDEVPLAVVHLAGGEGRLPPGGLAPVTVGHEPLAARPLRFPLVVEAQAASAFDDEHLASWQRAVSPARGHAPEQVAPPAIVDDADRIEDVILRRDSIRLFRLQRAPEALLGWGLAAATRAAPIDAASSDGLLEHLVNVHDVAGIEPGGYRYRGDGSYEGRTRADDVRAYSTRLCLDQPLGGDSAYTVFHSAHLDRLVAVLGPRAYRAALLQAGLVAGRLALDSVALGAGVTGLTFYDGLVSRYFRTEASALLATAVGLPATAPAPSGTPGHPVELRGYRQVMARLAARLQSA